MQHSESIANLAAALVAAQGEIQPIAKNSTNPHFRSKFASLDNIVDTVRPVLAKHGLGILQSGTPDVDGKLLVESRLLHKSGEWLTACVTIPMQKNDPQGVGSALTYGRRYGLAALLCLATEEDDDGNAASRPQQRSTNQRSGEQHDRPTRTPDSTPAAPAPQDAVSATARSKADEDKTYKGKRLGEYSDSELKGIVKQAGADHPELVKACRGVLAQRALGTTVDQQVDRMKKGVEEEEKLLPF